MIFLLKNSDNKIICKVCRQECISSNQLAFDSIYRCNDHYGIAYLENGICGMETIWCGPYIFMKCDSWSSYRVTDSGGKFLISLNNIDYFSFENEKSVIDKIKTYILFS